VQGLAGLAQLDALRERLGPALDSIIIITDA
jgi:hypothetical protein